MAVHNDFVVHNLPMSTILCDHHFNSRGEFRTMDVAQLAVNIQEHGLQSPIHVQEWADGIHEYRILAGHRRYTACLVNSATYIKAYVVKVDSEDDARDFNIIENLHRANLNILQEARAVNWYIKRGHSVADIARRLSRSPGWVEPRKQLLELPEDIQQYAADDVIDQQHIKSLFLLRHRKEEMYEQVRKIKEAKASGQKVIRPKPRHDFMTLTQMKPLKPSDIYPLLDHLAKNVIGPSGEENFGARCMALCCGSISLIEWCHSYKRECERLGLPFIPPDDVKEFIQ